MYNKYDCVFFDIANKIISKLLINILSQSTFAVKPYYGEVKFFVYQKKGFIYSFKKHLCSIRVYTFKAVVYFYKN